MFGEEITKAVQYYFQTSRLPS